MKHEKVIIAVAPVCHVGGELPKEAKNPLTASEIAEETIRCSEAGAALVHLHVRDEEGNQISDLSVFKKTIDLIRAKSDIIIQGSTGGLSSLSLEERCVCLNEPRVEMASLNMGSVNFGDNVYINTIPDIRYWIGRMKESKTIPELEIFNPSMIETSYSLAADGLLERPLRFGFGLGFTNSLSADPRNIAYLGSMVKDGDIWGMLHEGMENFRGIAAAFGLGAAMLRVGFEDGGYYGKGIPAKSNGELVEHLAAFIREAGKEIAEPEEARHLLGLPAV